MKNQTPHTHSLPDNQVVERFKEKFEKYQMTMMFDKALSENIQDFILSERALAKKEGYEQGRSDERRETHEYLKHEQEKFLDGFGHPKDCEMCKALLAREQGIME